MKIHNIVDWFDNVTLKTVNWSVKCGVETSIRTSY